MEVDLTSIILAVLAFFSAGGGVGYLLTLRSAKKKASAEAMKEVQDVYQETIADLRTDKVELKGEIDILKKIVTQNTTDITHLTRVLRTKGCANETCKKRIPIE